MGFIVDIPNEPSSKTQIFVINTQPKKSSNNEKPLHTKYGTKTVTKTSQGNLEFIKLICRIFSIFRLNFVSEQQKFTIKSCH